MSSDVQSFVRAFIHCLSTKNAPYGLNTSGKNAASRGVLANFTEGEYVLVAREGFFAGEKLALRWLEPRRIAKSLNDHVFLSRRSTEQAYRGHSWDKVEVLPGRIFRKAGNNASCPFFLNGNAFCASDATH